MRLYLKLSLMIALFYAGVLASDATGGGRRYCADAWFAVRCQFANVTHDRALEERLVEEVRAEWRVPPPQRRLVL
jgi:hypothetical protein